LNAFVMARSRRSSGSSTDRPSVVRMRKSLNAMTSALVIRAERSA
jgi:hypothetical protein